MNSTHQRASQAARRATLAFPRAARNLCVERQVEIRSAALSVAHLLDNDTPEIDSIADCQRERIRLERREAGIRAEIARRLAALGGEALATAAALEALQPPIHLEAVS